MGFNNQENLKIEFSLSDCMLLQNVNIYFFLFSRWCLMKDSLLKLSLYPSLNSFVLDPLISLYSELMKSHFY